MEANRPLLEQKPEENFFSFEKISIFRLKIYICNLKIRICSLKICIFNLKIELFREEMNFWPGIRKFTWEVKRFLSRYKIGNARRTWG